MKQDAELDPPDASDLEGGRSDIEDTAFMSWERLLASTLPEESVNLLVNGTPISSGNVSGGNNTSYVSFQLSDYQNQVEYYPLPVYPAGMPREEPVGVFGEMASNAAVLFDSANQGIQDADLPRPIAPFDYNLGGRHPVMPYTIISPEEMYQNRPPLPPRARWVSACAQRNLKQDDDQQPLEPYEILKLKGHEQAPLFQGRGFQMPPLEPQPTNTEHYQEDYFWAQQRVEIEQNQKLYKEGHLHLRLPSPLPDFDAEPPLLNSHPPPFEEHIFSVAHGLCQEWKAGGDHDQPSTPKPIKRQLIYGTPDHGTQNVPKTYPPKQAKAHRDDKRRRKSEFIFNKDTDFDIERSVSQLTGVLKEIAEDVKLNPATTVSQPFSSKSVEEIGPFHYDLRDTTVAVRRRSDPMNLDSVHWERRARDSTFKKRSSPDAKRNFTPLLGQDDSSSGQDSPTPERKKVRGQLRQPSRKASATIRTTRKKTPVTKRTASKKAKRKDPSTARAWLQSPPIKLRTRQLVPKSWEEASASDVLMFELRKQGAEFPTIAEVLRTTCGLNYLPRTLRNRYWKIETRIGEMPNTFQAWKMSANHDDVPEKKNENVTGKEVVDVPDTADEETSGLSTPNPDNEEDTWYF